MENSDNENNQKNRRGSKYFEDLRVFLPKSANKTILRVRRTPGTSSPVGIPLSSSAPSTPSNGSPPQTGGTPRALSPPLSRYNSNASIDSPLLRERSNTPTNPPSPKPTSPTASRSGSKVGQSRKESLRERYNIAKREMEGLEIPKRDDFGGLLYVKVRGAYDLPMNEEIMGGKFYVTVKVEESILKTKSTRAKSKVEWNEEFVFRVTDPMAALEVQVWHKKRSKNFKIENQFLGEVNIPLYLLEGTEISQDWFSLKPLNSQIGKEYSSENLGKIQLKLQYRVSRLSDMAALTTLENRYETLVKLLVEPEQKVVSVLCDVLDLTDREEVAAALVGIFDYHSLLQLLISSAIERELKKESETSLLQNSMAIRFASFYLTFSASEFLKLALQGCIISLSLTPDHSIYEIDPTKVSDPNVLQQNIQNLCTVVNKFLVSIYRAGENLCPKKLRHIIYTFLNTKKYSEDFWCKAIGRILFVRFFCYAIVTPSEYELVPEGNEISQECSRNLIAIAQILTRIATNSVFPERNGHMTAFNAFISSHAETVKNWIKSLSEMQNFSYNSFRVTSSKEVVKDVLEIHKFLERYRSKIFTPARKEDSSFPYEALETTVRNITEDKKSNAVRLYNVSRRELEKKGAVKILGDTAYSKFVDEMEIIQKIRENRGILNIEEVTEVNVQLEGNFIPSELAEQLISKIHLIYTQYEGKWSEIKKSKSFKTFVLETGKLQQLDLSSSKPNQKLAFWCNIFNTLVLHIHVLLGPPADKVIRSKFFTYYHYQIGGEVFNLNDIRDNVLRNKSTSPSVKQMSPPFDNKIHFALTLLNQSSPSLRIFKSAIIEEQLAKCMSDYLKKRIKLDLTKKKIILPTVFETYPEDFESAQRSLLKSLIPYLSTKKRLDLVLLLEQANYSIKYSDYSWDIALVPPVTEAYEQPSPAPEVNPKQQLMKKIDKTQTSLQILWLEISRSLVINDIVTAGRIIRNLHSELSSFKNTEEIALLELLREEKFSLSSQQKEQFGEQAKSAKKLLQVLFLLVKEMDCILTHLLMSLVDYDEALDKLLDKIIATAESTVPQNPNSNITASQTQSELRDAIVRELAELVDYCQMISQELKAAELSKEDDQHLIVMMAMILAFTKRQLENKAEVLPPLTILPETIKIKVSEHFSKLNEIKNRSKLVLGWLYQKFKSASLVYSSALPFDVSELILFGTQIRNIRNAFSYIQGKRAKRQNPRRRLTVSHDRLTQRLLQASTEKDKLQETENYSLEDL